MLSAVQSVLDKARQEIGVREIGGSNTGKRVREYQASTTLGGSGWPWCAAWVSWCILTALGKSLCDAVWTRSASCDVVLAWAKKAGILSATPIPGCAGLVLASKTDATHIFLVEEVNGNIITTIEGNTNDDGSREGNGVYRRKRKVTGRLIFVHWQKLLPANYTTKEEAVTAPASFPKPFANAIGAELWLSGQKKATVPVLNGVSYLPAKVWATWMNAELGWNAEAQSVTFNGKEVPAQPILYDGAAWLPIRVMAEFYNLDVTPEPGKVLVTK